MTGPDRHPFVSTFLVVFLLDGALGLVVAVAYVTSRSLFDPDRLLPVTGPFGLAVLLAAMVQVTLTFSRNMRWSARALGLFVIGWQFLMELAALVLLRGDAPAPEDPVLSDPATGWLMLVVNTAQLGLGVWAIRDLARGHYRAAPAGGRAGGDESDRRQR